MAADAACAAVAVLLLTAAGSRPAGSADLALVLCWPLLLLASGAYDSSPAHRDRRRARVLRASAALGLLCWSAPTVTEVAARPGELVLVTAALTASALLLRAAGDTWGSRSADAGATRLLVAGDTADLAGAVAELHRGPRPQWQVVTACVTDEPGTGATALDVPVVAGIDDLVGHATAVDADAVLVLPCASLAPLALRRVAWQLEAAGIDLYVGTALHDVAPARATVMTAGDLGFLQVRPPTSASPARVVKDLSERAGAAVLLLALLPLLCVVAIAVRRDSPGPAIYRQRRIGRDGSDFTMYKFRTMRTDADVLLTDLTAQNESDGSVLFKMRQDPRITRLGATLRKYSIDELPQLVNVVRGDMALIGPRPALPDEVARYDHDPRRRLCVKPGLTGLWQVSGRSDLSWEDTVRLDVHYVDNWSLGLDVRIAWRTIGAVLRHNGAY